MNAIMQKMPTFFSVNCFIPLKILPGTGLFVVFTSWCEWQLVKHIPFKYRYTGSTEAQELASRRRRLSLPKVWWAIRTCSTQLHQQDRLQHRVQWTTSPEETVINSQDLKHRCALLSKKFISFGISGSVKFCKLLSTAKS